MPKKKESGGLKNKLIGQIEEKIYQACDEFSKKHNTDEWKGPDKEMRAILRQGEIRGNEPYLKYVLIINLQDLVKENDENTLRSSTITAFGQFLKTDKKVISRLAPLWVDEKRELTILSLRKEKGEKTSDDLNTFKYHNSSYQIISHNQFIPGSVFVYSNPVLSLLEAFKAKQEEREFNAQTPSKAQTISNNRDINNNNSSDASSQNEDTEMRLRGHHTRYPNELNSGHQNNDGDTSATDSENESTVYSEHSNPSSESPLSPPLTEENQITVTPRIDSIPVNQGLPLDPNNNNTNNSNNNNNTSISIGASVEESPSKILESLNEMIDSILQDKLLGEKEKELMLKPIQEQKAKIESSIHLYSDKKQIKYNRGLNQRKEANEALEKLTDSASVKILLDNNKEIDEEKSGDTDEEFLTPPVKKLRTSYHEAKSNSAGFFEKGRQKYIELKKKELAERLVVIKARCERIENELGTSTENSSFKKS